MSTATGAGTIRWIGIACLAVGLFGYVLAARAIGGTYIAYRDHLLGFVLLTAGFGGLTVLIGRRFWRPHPEWIVLAVGVVQALFGVYVYIERFSVHG